MRCIYAAFIMAMAAAIHVASGAGTNIEEIIRKGVADRNTLSKLSTNDIPESLRTRVEEQATNNYIKKTYLRGGDKILEVMWRTNWTGPQSNEFTATVYDGSKKIGKLVAFSSTAVAVTQTSSTKMNYDMITSVKTNGAVEIMFTNEKGYLQIIEACGRNTKLLDDLEYMKTSTLMDDVKPLVDSVKDSAEKSPKK